MRNFRTLKESKTFKTFADSSLFARKLDEAIGDSEVISESKLKRFILNQFTSYAYEKGLSLNESKISKHVTSIFGGIKKEVSNSGIEILESKETPKENRVKGYSNQFTGETFLGSPLDQVMKELGQEKKVSVNQIKNVLKKYFQVLFQKYDAKTNSFKFSTPSEYNDAIEKILPQAKKALENINIIVR